MKYTGILFKGEMVRAILDGKKTQTRRVIKIQPDYPEQPYYWRKQRAEMCPYGKAGDKLWVRETWVGNYEKDIIYKADIDKPEFVKWKPSIYMPRKYSRITLEITNIRVERVQDIRENDAKAEGIRVVDNTPEKIYSLPNYPDIHRDIFMDLWDSINEKRGYSWEKNPYVWVIEFKREANK